LAVTFEAWEDDTLAGLIAAYLDDRESGKGFITNVSVLKEQMGKGIAETLMNNCIAYAKQQGIRSIDLEVSKGSEPAIALYENSAFWIAETKKISCR